MNYLETGLKVLKEIKNLGYDAYIVGGAVRDNLLKRDVNDIDISSSIPLDILKRKFNVSDTGGKYLSVTIFCDGYSYEITNFRKDLKYYKNRFPDVELISDFKTDTIRRDFTINALAYDSDGDLVDYHNGMDDLNNKLIRCIGNPDTRFNEDALRILRCLYFSSKLDFDIEEETLNSIIRNKSLLANLSDERIWEYVYKLYKNENKRGIEYINKYDLFEYIPKYKNVLSFAKKDDEHLDVFVTYYLKYKEYLPLTTSKEKKIIKEFLEVVDNNFSKFSIYYNQDIFEYKNVFLNMGYDYNKLIDIKNNLIIKSDKELALSKGEISTYLKPEDRNAFIKHLINGILEGRIVNEKNAIVNEVKLWK